MPQTILQAFVDSNGESPFQEWFDDIESTEPRAYAKCIASLKQLEISGYELKRPTADFLQDGIYELRFRVGTVHWRVLYFFHGKNTVVLSHGFTKESEVPKKEIRKAIQRKKITEKNPDKHTVSWEIPQ